MSDGELFYTTVQDQLVRARRSRARYETLLRKHQASPIEVLEARNRELRLQGIVDRQRDAEKTERFRD